MKREEFHLTTPSRTENTYKMCLSIPDEIGHDFAFKDNSNYCNKQNLYTFQFFSLCLPSIFLVLGLDVYPSSLSPCHLCYRVFQAYHGLLSKFLPHSSPFLFLLSYFLHTLTSALLLAIPRLLFFYSTSSFPPLFSLVPHISYPCSFSHSSSTLSLLLSLSSHSSL